MVGLEPRFVQAAGHSGMKHGDQFPDIAFPVLHHQGVNKIIGHGLWPDTKLGANFFHVIIGQKHDLIGPFPQRGQVNVVGDQTIEKVFPELPLFHHYKEL